MTGSDVRRVLLLAPFPPSTSATHGGARAIAQLALALAQRVEVGVVYLRAAAEEPPDGPVTAACTLLEEVERPLRDAVTRSVRRLALLGRGIPVWAGDVALPPFRDRVSTTVRSWRPAVVQAEYHIMAPHAKAVGDAARPVTVLNLHEPGSRAAREQRTATRGPARVAAAVDALAWRRFERRALTALDAVVVFTVRDRDDVLALAPDAEVRCIPLAVAPGEAAAAAAAPAATRPTLLFVGSFVHPPNVEAAVHAARDVLPKVRAVHPEAVLQIVGDGPPRRVRELAGPGVVVTGRVESVSPYLDAATVVLAPLGRGGGTRVKVLEAMAAGKAVVASPLAAAGLEDGSEHLVIAEDEGFAAAVSDLLASPGRRAALGAGARSWVLAERSPAAWAGRYVLLYESLAARGANR